MAASLATTLYRIYGYRRTPMFLSSCFMLQQWKNTRFQNSLSSMNSVYISSGNIKHSEFSFLPVIHFLTKFCCLTATNGTHPKPGAIRCILENCYLYEQDYAYFNWLGLMSSHQEINILKELVAMIFACRLFQKLIMPSACACARHAWETQFHFRAWLYHWRSRLQEVWEISEPKMVFTDREHFNDLPKAKDLGEADSRLDPSSTVSRLVLVPPYYALWVLHWLPSILLSTNVCVRTW